METTANTPEKAWPYENARFGGEAVLVDRALADEIRRRRAAAGNSSSSTGSSVTQAVGHG